MKSDRFLVCLAVCGIVLLLARSEVSQAQIATPSRIPSTQIQTRALDIATPDPVVNQATPKSPTVAIGGQTASMTLNGRFFTQVTAVEAVNAAGVVQPHIDAYLSPNARSDGALTVQLVAKKNARPGQYQLKLLSRVDPRQVQNRPPSAPLGGAATRDLTIPATTAAVRVRAMEPKITSFAPTRPAYNTTVGPRIVVSDVPGSEVVSVTRHEGDRFCRYRPIPSLASPHPGYRGGLALSTWTAPNTLQVLMLTGTFEPASSCTIQLSIRTKNAFGEEFQSFTPAFQLTLSAPPPPARLPVSSTWTLKSYLHLQEMLQKGTCSGNSLGAHGSVPVGIVNVNGKLGFRIRSGPIGTECGWKLATNRLEPGWKLHMTFRIRRSGDKCNVGSGPSQYDFSRLQRITILNDGEQTLAANLSQDGNALKLVDLHCGLTLSNDHEVLLEMVSAAVSHDSPPNGCDWKCAFR